MSEQTVVLDGVPGTASGLSTTHGRLVDLEKAIHDLDRRVAALELEVRQQHAPRLTEAEKGVAEHRKVLRAIREQLGSLAQWRERLESEMSAISRELSNLRADVGRCVTAATTASAGNDRILRALGHLAGRVEQLVDHAKLPPLEEIAPITAQYGTNES